MFTDPLSFEPSSDNYLCSIQLHFSVPHFPYSKVTPDGSVVKNLPDNAGDSRDMGSIPGSGRFPGEGNGNPLQHSCLENPWTEEPGGLGSLESRRVGHD